MVHRHEHLLFTSQLWLPYLAFCFDPSECFWDLCIWSRAMGNKSGKLQYVSQIMTTCHTLILPYLQYLRAHSWVMDPLGAVSRDGYLAITVRCPAHCPT